MSGIWPCSELIISVPVTGVLSLPVCPFLQVRALYPVPAIGLLSYFLYIRGPVVSLGLQIPPTLRGEGFFFANPSNAYPTWVLYGN